MNTFFTCNSAIATRRTNAASFASSTKVSLPQHFKPFSQYSLDISNSIACLVIVLLAIISERKRPYFITDFMPQMSFFYFSLDIAKTSICFRDMRRIFCEDDIIDIFILRDSCREKQLLQVVKFYFVFL